MSENEEELELQALQRELDDAFATTRPRAGYEDELWMRMQAQRPAPNKIREAFAGFWQNIRVVPAVPAAAIAGVLVVVIGAGFLVYGGFGPRGAATSSAPASGRYQDQGGQLWSGATFGRLPTPVFNPVVRNSGGAPQNLSDGYAGPKAYFGPATLTWAGELKVTISNAPVFRYREPSAAKADEFAAALGASLDDRPTGYLGAYSARYYTLQVRGTVQSPPQSPTYSIIANRLMPPVTATGASASDIASYFLAEHNLVPQWPNTVVVQKSGETTQVIFVRQFDASGYGPARLIDSQGEPYGLEVDLNGNSVLKVVGLLPVNLDSATYPVISGDQAIRAALTPSSNQSASSTSGPAVQLTSAELVYVLAPARDYGYYEPAYLFSGTFQMNGTTYVMRVLVPAIPPSQRS